jgi:hypothetical protein
MSRLFATAVVREPRPTRPPPSSAATIHTHPQGASSAPAQAGPSLHDALYTAWSQQRWAELDALARKHVQGADLLSRLHPIGAAAVRFVQPGPSAFTPGDVSRLASSFDPAALEEYAGAAYARDAAVIADWALAMQCFGALGGADVDPIAGLRGVTAIAAAARVRERAGAPPARLGLIKRALSAHVYLPWWSFHLDPCKGRILPGYAERPGPLRIRQGWQEPRDDGRPDCGCPKEDDLPCAPQDPCCSEIRYYMADVLELRDWTHCYRAGDLADITVVAAGESLEREHTMKRTRELFTEDEASGRWSERRDHQATDRATLQREIERQVESSQSAEASAGGKYNSGAYSAEFSATGALKRSASEAVREAQERSKELVTSAVSEIEKQTRTLRSERVVTEETERNVHGYDNAKGTSPKVTKFFWVTQERRAQLFSHGRHLVAELIVPSPARLYERLVWLRREAEVAKLPKPTLQPPKKPADLVVKPEEIAPGNYLQLCAQHGVQAPPAPPAFTAQISAPKEHGAEKQGSIGSVQLDVPPNHHAVSIQISGGASFKNPLFGSKTKKVEFIVAGVGVWFSGDQNALADRLSANLPNLTGTQFVNVEAWNLDSLGATVTLQLALVPSVLGAWQQAVFAAIKEAHAAAVAAYESAQAEYDKAQADYKAEQEELRKELEEKEKGRHPFHNRELERAELKRAAIYLMCQDFSNQGATIPHAEPCGLPEIHRGRARAWGDEWYFWDRLFDWKHMAYAFFDYFWNPISSWPERFDPDEPDPLFKAFRRAGYARLLVPVQRDMEQDFLWYASTRKKWGPTGHPPLDPNDPRWQNVVFELQHASASAMTPREGHVSGVAPGDLTVLVKGSDRYWDDVAGAVDPAAVAADLDRELLIDGDTYLIADIQLDSGSPAYDPNNPDTMWWRITLDRPYTGAASARRLYAMGAQAVAPVFSFDMPTELIWAGAHDDCLPCYPLPPCA